MLTATRHGRNVGYRAGGAVPVGTGLLPSPASPAATRGWTEQGEAQLRALGVEM